MDNIIQQINCYPTDKHLKTPLLYPQDRDLSSGYQYPLQMTKAQKFLKIMTEGASTKAWKFLKNHDWRDVISNFLNS